jgi:hypothetical protein
MCIGALFWLTTFIFRNQHQFWISVGMSIFVLTFVSILLMCLFLAGNVALLTYVFIPFWFLIGKYYLFVILFIYLFSYLFTYLFLLFYLLFSLHLVYLFYFFLFLNKINRNYALYLVLLIMYVLL